MPWEVLGLSFLKNFGNSLNLEAPSMCPNIEKRLPYEANWSMKN